MPYSRVSYTGTGSILNATFPFSYLNQADIFVYVDGVSVPFTFLNGSTVIPNANPVAGSIVQVRRITQKNTPPVNFTDGSVLLERDLDLLALYGLYVAQESDDGVQSALTLNLQNQLDARSLRVVNLAPGVAPTDAVNKAQNDATILASAGSASAASSSAGAASASASQAAISASAAQTSGSAVALQASLADTVDVAKGDALVGIKRTIPGAVSRSLHDWHEVHTLGFRGTFGAVGDGVADDSAKFITAVAYCAANNKALWFEGGSYYLPNTGTLTGRVMLRGGGDVLLITNMVYNDTAFTASADIGGTYTPTKPFFSSKGINYKAANNITYALKVQTNDTGSFQDAGEIYGASFYGKYGLQAINLITFTLSDCWFYNSKIGVLAQAGTNWTVHNCKFRDCAEAGFVATDFNTVRRGGENIRFSQCEFDVCSKGVYLLRTMYASFDNCLMDYCILPLHMVGSQYVKMSKCYLGSSSQATLTSSLDYVAPPFGGTALYAEGHISGAIREASGITCVACEFVNYAAGSNRALVHLNGYDASNASARLIDSATFIGCKFLQANTHVASHLAYFEYCQQLMLVGNQFTSYNLSTTLLSPFFIGTTTHWQAIGSDVYLCTQASVPVKNQYGLQYGGAFAMMDDTYTLEFKNKSLVSSLSLLGGGNDRVRVFVGGAMQTMGVGVANSAGTGFRTLNVPN